MSVRSVCREWRNISLDLFLHSFIGKFVHLDAEIDEDKETDATDIGIDRTAEGKGIVYAVGNDRNEEDACCRARGAVAEMIDGIIVAHQNGKGVMARNG